MTLGIPVLAAIAAATGIPSGTAGVSPGTAGVGTSARRPRAIIVARPVIGIATAAVGIATAAVAGTITLTTVLVISSPFRIILIPVPAAIFLFVLVFFLAIP
jgi:hypothetical protein